MTFPSVSGTPTSTAFNADSTTHNVTLPATLNAGDLILIVASFDGTPTISASGYVDVGAQDTNLCATAVLAKVSDGSEDGATLNVATSASEQGTVNVFRIVDWFGTLTGGADCGAHALLLNTASNPAPGETITPAWESQQTLWIDNIVAMSNAAQNITAAPSGFGGLIGGGATGGANSAELWSASLQSVTKTQSPGAWTGSGGATDDWKAFVIGIRPKAEMLRYARPNGIIGQGQYTQIIAT